MVAYIDTFTFLGIDIVDVHVQVHLAGGIPAFNVVGLADKMVTESRERVRAALHSLGLSLPPKRITVNLSPADLVKEGSHFDLPIACAILVALDVLPAESLKQYMVMGELGLDARILPVAGVLPAAIGAHARGKGLICPALNAAEAVWAGNGSVIGPEHLLSLIHHIKGTQLLPPPTLKLEPKSVQYPDLQDVLGQETAKRALEIAAAGGHHLLFSGPPGAGKSMLATRLPGLLPPLTSEEILECSMIASVAGLLTGGELQHQRPFRSPHHSCSVAAMVGGGKSKRVLPGEISLAHRGVLFLDELPEFPRNVLESLRQPIEARHITIARAQAHVTYPSAFQMVAAMNPCRCGHLGDPRFSCAKAPRCGEDYQSKISGPLWDRIDIFVALQKIDAGKWVTLKAGEPTEVVAKRIAAARAIQHERYKQKGSVLNSSADGDVLRQVANPDEAGHILLSKAAEQLRLSMRAYHRVLRVARTIADLEGIEGVKRHHIAEALGYRP